MRILFFADSGNNECELNNVAVLPDYRHKGIGKMLIDHAFCLARELGCNVINKQSYEKSERVESGW